jgi:hypothetical protein
MFSPDVGFERTTAEPSADRIAAKKLAPEAGFEPTIRRGGLTTKIQARAYKFSALTCFEPAFAPERLWASSVRFESKPGPKGQGNVSWTWGKAARIVVFLKALL